MRTPETERDIEKWGLIAVVAACVAWILWHDIQYLFPLMGIVGGLIALYDRRS